MLLTNGQHLHLESISNGVNVKAQMQFALKNTLHDRSKSWKKERYLKRNVSVCVKLFSSHLRFRPPTVVYLEKCRRRLSEGRRKKRRVFKGQVGLNFPICKITQ